MADGPSKDCPWKVTDNAVRRYLELTGQARRLSLEEGQTELTELARRTWESGREPTRSKRGARVYRTPQPRRLKLVIADDNHIVDVGAAHEGMERGRR